MKEIAPSDDSQTAKAAVAERAASALERCLPPFTAAGVGTVAAVLMEGQIVTACTGEMPQGRAMSADARLRIGCLLKPFTATLILQLMDEGLLHIDDPVSRYVPIQVSGAEAICLRHLLTHTSGLRDCEIEDLELPYEATAAEIIEHLRVAIFSEPGSAFSYSGLGYLLLEAVVEAVAHQPFADVLRQKLLTPLDIGFTTRGPSNYYRNGVGRNLWVSCTELLKFVVGFLDSLESKGLLSNASAGEMLQAVAPMSGPAVAFESWALGWGRVCEGVYGHHAATVDGRLILRFDVARRRALVVAAPYSLAPLVAQSVTRNFLNSNWAPSATQEGLSVIPTTECVGDYVRQRGGMLTVSVQNGLLKGRLKDRRGVRAVHFKQVSDRQFLLVADDGQLVDLCSFVVTSGGRYHLWNGLQLDPKAEQVNSGTALTAG